MVPSTTFIREILHSFRSLDEIKQIENDVALGLLETLPVQIIVVPSEKEKRCSSRSPHSPKHPNSIMH